LRLSSAAAKGFERQDAGAVLSNRGVIDNNNSITVRRMRIIPVMDLMAGQVVRGIAGRRAEYRPLVSPLCGSSAPLEVARAFRGLGFSEMYLADLDAIAGATPAILPCATWDCVC
jgi:hypothetical protein